MHHFHLPLPPANLRKRLMKSLPPYFFLPFKFSKPHVACRVEGQLAALSAPVQPGGPNSGTSVVGAEPPRMASKAVQVAPPIAEVAVQHGQQLREVAVQEDSELDNSEASMEAGGLSPPLPQAQLDVLDLLPDVPLGDSADEGMEDRSSDDSLGDNHLPNPPAGAVARPLPPPQSPPSSPEAAASPRRQRQRGGRRRQRQARRAFLQRHAGRQTAIRGVAATLAELAAGGHVQGWSMEIVDGFEDESID